MSYEHKSAKTPGEGNRDQRLPTYHETIATDIPANGYQSQQYGEFSGQNTKSNKNYITEDIRRYLLKIYGFILLGVIVFGISATLFTLLIKKKIDGGNIDEVQKIMIGLLLVCIIGSIFTWLVIAFVSRKWFVLKTVCYFLFVVFEGGFCSIILTKALDVNPNIIPTAVIATVVIVVGLSAVALMAKRTTFLYLGGFLLTLSIIGLVCLIMNIFFNSKILELVIICLYIVIHSGSILYYTQVIIVMKVDNNEEDLIRSAFLILSTIIYLFMEILKLLIATNQKK